jgi:membrane protease YdiL (CAAX protease family)
MGRTAGPGGVAARGPAVNVAPSSASTAGLPERLRGFGPLGVLAFVVIFGAGVVSAPLSAVLILVWAFWSRTPWREIGYARPRSWIGTIAAGIVFGVAFKLLMKAIVMPLFGAPPINAAYHHLAGSTAALPGMLLAVLIGAGFGEETFYRGYLFERLGKLFGTAPPARIATLVLTAALFAVAHYSGQGVAGVQQAAITGLVFGTMFALTGRIWLALVTHVAFDVAAVAIIYLDVEAAVAHLVFR